MDVECWGHGIVTSEVELLPYRSWWVGRRSNTNVRKLANMNLKDRARLGLLTSRWHIMASQAETCAFIIR